MKRIGTFLLAMGVVSAILHTVGYELRLLMWVETWGPAVGWSIRAGLAIAGAGLLVVASKTEPAAS